MADEDAKVAVADQNEMGGPLRFRIWVTRGCHFTMADRMNRKARWSIWATTLLSFYVVVLSLVLVFFPDKVSDTSSRLISAGTLILSIFIIIVSQSEHAKGHDLKAMHAGQSANDLAFLFNQIEEAETPADEKAHIRRYNEILQQARLRHEMIDYNGFQLANPAEFNYGWLRWTRIGLLYLIENFVEYWIYAIMAVGPLIPIFYVISGVVNGGL